MGDNIIQEKINNMRLEKIRTQKNLFTQFSPILTYSRGESSFPFHYNDEFLYKDISKGYKN